MNEQTSSYDQGHLVFFIFFIQHFSSLYYLLKSLTRPLAEIPAVWRLDILPKMKLFNSSRDSPTDHPTMNPSSGNPSKQQATAAGTEIRISLSLEMLLSSFISSWKAVRDSNAEVRGIFLKRSVVEHIPTDLIEIRKNQRRGFFHSFKRQP